MSYFFTIAAVLCIGGQFSFTKLYQSRARSGLFASAIFTLLGATVAILLYAALALFRLPINPFSFGMAAGSSLCIALYTLLGIKMMSMGRMTVYTLFVMLGGMFLPFLYGVLFLHEAFTWLKGVGLALLVGALILPAVTKKDEKRPPVLFYVLCAVVFLANGANGIFNKAHQISAQAIPVFAYGFWQNLICLAAMALVCGVLLLQKDSRPLYRDATVTAVKNWWIILLYVVVMQAGSVFMLLAASEMPASMLFPATTGGAVVVSAIFGRLFFHEKLTARIIVSLVLALGATVLFMF